MSDKAIDVQVASAHSRPFGEEVKSQTASLPRGLGILPAVFLMARVTFREAGRRKILWIAIFVALLFLVLFAIAVHAMLVDLSRNPGMTLIRLRESVTMMTMMVLYAGTMMTSLMAALTSCDTLSGEIASGTIHAIATKPVRRWCLVLGKWTGFVGMLSIYVLLVEGGTVAIAWAESHYLIGHSGVALGLIWLQAVLLLSITMAASTRFSALTSGAISLGLYGLAFVGGWVEQYGSIQHVRVCVDLGILSSLLMPSDALWRRAAFKIQPPLLGGVGATPFSAALTPSTAMVIYAAIYAVWALLLAQLLFERRDL